MEILAKHSWNSGREIPIDLLIDIFSRVPAKTIAKCRCVSRLWRSIFCQPYFTDLFLTMSWTRERLFLFTIEDESNLYFYSSPQPQILDESTCLVVPTTRYHGQQKPSLAGDRIYTVGSPFPGFVCLERQNTMAIWNPVTGDSVSLPKVELAEQKFLRAYTIYKKYTVNDPVDKQSKEVVSIHTVTHDEYHLLRVDNENHFWRIPQCKTHHPLSNGVCIDGVVYYTASRAGSDADSRIVVFMIVCSNVSSEEEFSFINIHKDMAYSTLINYKGKLALLKFLYRHMNSLQSPIYLEFCVLQDAEKNIFSKRIYTWPLLLRNMRFRSPVRVLGMTGTGDVLVLAAYPKHSPANIYYFNLENNSFRRAQIQGLEVFNDYKIHISLDYVENFKQCPSLRLDM